LRDQGAEFAGLRSGRANPSEALLALEAYSHKFKIPTLKGEGWGTRPDD